MNIKSKNDGETEHVCSAPNTGDTASVSFVGQPRTVYDVLLLVYYCRGSINHIPYVVYILPYSENNKNLSVSQPSRVQFCKAAATAPALVACGVPPTFEDKPRAHILRTISDFTGVLYQYTFAHTLVYYNDTVHNERYEYKNVFIPYLSHNLSYIKTNIKLVRHSGRSIHITYTYVPRPKTPTTLLQS